MKSVAWIVAAGMFPLLLAGCSLFPFDPVDDSDEKVVVLTADGRVEALSANDGVLLWSTTISTGGNQEGALLRSAGTLFVHSGGDRLVALSPDTGEELWWVELNDDALGPMAADGLHVYLHTYNRVHAVSLGGLLSWTSPLPGLGYSLAIGPSSLYVGGDPIRQLTASDGLTRASFDTGDSDVRALLPTTDALYSGTRDALVALDPLELFELWAFPTGVQVQAISEAGDLYAGTNGAGLVALTSDGELLWEAQPDSIFDAVTTAPGLVAGNLVGDALLAFDISTGDELWRAPGGGASLGLIKTDVALLHATGSTVLAVDPVTGARLWEALPSSQVWAIAAL